MFLDCAEEGETLEDLNAGQLLFIEHSLNLTVSSVLRAIACLRGSTCSCSGRNVASLKQELVFVAVEGVCMSLLASLDLC